jgi:uncharacterized small protein (DUF1192 family)
MTSIQFDGNQIVPVAPNWVGLTSLSSEQIDRQIAAISAKLEALKAELAGRAAANS